ncbi:DNA-methyltransferase [Mucilaginibacter flavus]|uniref:DNA-methyltransferase n=1 Tax=Mucilaginibacter flavus TaxID=931504 RepID=UPI0025B612A3|nr:site-specific DNA-methyltransferase [Mucilaginibacter flavus]MDN3580945.1 site-specific DNA-methyltransferase [Mucilaginibacter flavus]
MKEKDSFFKVLGIDGKDKKTLQLIAEDLNISLKTLNYYNLNSILPPDNELEKMATYFKINRYQIMIGMGIYNQELKELLSQQAAKIAQGLSHIKTRPTINHEQVFTTSLGQLFEGDCLSLMPTIESGSVDLVFADPPFNLDKLYPSNMDDNIASSEYIRWTEQWLSECIRILKPGGSLFLWNIPKWNTYFSEFLNHRLNFRHWIATDIKYSLPISSRLYPSHYGLLYYIKQEKASVFKPDRLKMETCQHCYRELRDYGGYKDKMNPSGINMPDVWYDIPPVRHSKHKKRKDANELSIKLLDRIIEMATVEGDIVFDPFGGSGTTYLVAELKRRKWIGIELGPTEVIVDRLKNKAEEEDHLNKYRENYNQLFPEKIKKERIKRGIWTDDSFKPEMKDHQISLGLFIGNKSLLSQTK